MTDIRTGRTIFEQTLFEVANGEALYFRKKSVDIEYINPFFNTRKITNYIYPETHLETGRVTVLNAIPIESSILSIMVQVSEITTNGSITLGAIEGGSIIPGAVPEEIFSLENVRRVGAFTANSAIDYFQNKQHLVIDIVGSIKFSIKILYWRINR